jgi:hypothetical protein
MQDVGAQAELMQSLQAVELERARRHGHPALGQSVLAVKALQQGRFRLTYADLLADRRWGPAGRFFLDELYGPQDFTDRDRAFARVVPALVKLFPAEVIDTVRQLLRLHAVSERLDSAMGATVSRMRDAAVASGVDGPQSTGLSGEDYRLAWCEVGERNERDWQVSAVVGIGRALDQLTHRSGLRHALRLMRGPAHLAGLGVLQHFLERGFDTFRAMNGADTFLATLADREAQWIDWLFDPARGRGVAGRENPVWLGQFP